MKGPRPSRRFRAPARSFHVDSRFVPCLSALVGGNLPEHQNQLSTNRR